MSMEKSAEQALREQSAHIEREEIYRGRVISVRRDTYVFDAGTPNSADAPDLQLGDGDSCKGGDTGAVKSDFFSQIRYESHSWDIVVHPGAVVIIPVTKNKEFLLVKQWRRAAGKILLEFPAGTLEKGEAPSLCAQRELQEETGYRAHRILPLGGFFTAPGFCTEYLHLFLALDLEEAPDAPHDDDEAIDLISVSFKELETLIAQQQIQDAKTIAGFYRYGQWAKSQE